MANIIDRTGEENISNEGLKMSIISCKGNRNIDIKFEDGFITYNKSYTAFIKGNIKNPYHKAIYNEGFYGEGSSKSRNNGIKTKAYIHWLNMLSRCYSEKERQKQPTYKDVTVCDEWKCFQNFAKWHEKNYNPETMQGWHLDKDILVKGNKIYSPETCCFVPKEINCLFIKRQNDRGEYPIGVVFHRKTSKFGAQISKNGVREWMGLSDTVQEAFQVYKKEKEKYTKEVADKWKILISDEVYKAMYNWKVEITD